MNIFLSPSCQIHNIYAYGNTNEHVQCKRIADAVRDYLQGYDCNVKTAEQAWSIKQRAEEAKAFNADFYICIHTNAASNTAAKGAETYFYPTDTEGKALAEKLLNDITTLGIAKRRCIAQPTLGELLYPTCTRTYIEVDFHSNSERAKWIIENTTAIGECIAKSIVEYFCISKKKAEEKYCKVIAESPVILIEDAEKVKAELTASGYIVELREADKPTEGDTEDKPKEEEPTAESKTELKVGDKVKLLSDAVIYGTNSRFAGFVYNKNLFVRSINGNRIVVSTLSTGAVTGAVDKKYLIKL